MCTESKGDIDRARTEEQRAAYAGTIGQGVCPFCGKTEDLPKEIREQILIEGVYWRAWRNPFPYPGHAAHIILAPIQHWTQPGEGPPEAAQEWMEINVRLIQELELPGGGIVMRFGGHEHKGGSITHLHSHIQVPNRKTFSIAVFYADNQLKEFLRTT